MLASDFETSQYLNAKSAGKYNGTTAKIFEVKAATINDKRKMVIGFEGIDKMLVVNKTNRDILTEAYGNDTDQWLDKSVVIGIVLVMFEGKRTPSILLTPHGINQSQINDNALPDASQVLNDIPPVQKKGRK
jgi:hypothetical protein